MPSTFTPSLRLEEQGVGENNNTWGERLNTSLNLADKAIAGHIAVPVVAGVVILSAINNSEDEARYRIIELTGSLGDDVIVQVPEVSKEYIVWDSTDRNGRDIAFRLGAGGQEIPIPSSGRGFGISTDGAEWRPVSPYIATEAEPGIVELATTAQAQAGTSGALVITASTLQQVTATESRKGVVELATNAEAQVGTDTNRALTPAALQAVTATESRAGVAEVATQLEVTTATANNRMLTPQNVQHLMASVSEAVAGTSSKKVINPSVLKSIVNAIKPPGEITIWSGSASNIPDGFALCNGSNGTPDLRNRFVVGAGSSYNPGDRGGANTVALNINQMPSHNHTGYTNTTGSHAHTYTGTRGGDTDGGGDNMRDTGSKTTSSAGNHSHSLHINNRGGSQPHENRPPYYALCYIMWLGLD